jgi:putative tryptophan/tyrosine transport system substrate-binding protein
VRREFVAVLAGGAAPWPLRAWAQSATTIGYLDLGSPETRRDVVMDVQRALSERGYIEGRNLAVEHRWTLEDSLNRLPDLAADLVDLVGLRVAAIIALQLPVVLAAKSATHTIPIVFGTPNDPVEAGPVASLNWPGGNLTGSAKAALLAQVPECLLRP